MKTIDRATYRAARQSLTAGGWEEVLTACSSLGDSGTEFGILYAKDGKEFWLNFKTIDNLPTAPEGLLEMLECRATD